MAEFDHWMKFHIGDYLADTMHLSTFQHGIYVLLIMHAFKHGDLPNDEPALRRIAKVPSVLQWRQAAPAVMALWHLENDVWRHTRIDSTRAEAQTLSEERRKAGKSGASKRWGMANAKDGNGKSHASARPPARDSTTTYQDSPPVTPRRGGARTAPDFKCGFGESASVDMQETPDHADETNARSLGATVVSIARRVVGC